MNRLRCRLRRGLADAKRTTYWVGAGIPHGLGHFWVTTWACRADLAAVDVLSLIRTGQQICVFWVLLYSS